MTDTILLKPADQISTGGLGRGELAIDVEGRKLFLESAGVPKPIALDVTAVPEPSEDDVAAGYVLLQGVDGPYYGALIRGAGGTPIVTNETEWCIPGVALTEIVDQTIAVAWSAEIEISEPVRLTGLRVFPDSGVDITMQFGVKSLAGADIARKIESAYSGAVETGADIPIDPGRYQLFMEVDAPLDFVALRGFLPWGTIPHDYPVFLRMVPNASA